MFCDDDILQNYYIRITGHSLVGAGAASVLALLLRAQYKELHEPGRLHALHHPSAVKSKDFITSVANRNDCVPRLYVSNFEIMVNMLEGLNEKIMTQEGLDSFWSIAKESVVGDVMEQLLTDDQFDALINIMEEAQGAVEIEAGEYLCVPGKIIALYGTIKDLPAKGEEPDVTVQSVFFGSSTFLPEVLGSQ